MDDKKQLSKKTAGTQQKAPPKPPAPDHVDAVDEILSRRWFNRFQHRDGKGWYSRAVRDLWEHSHNGKPLLDMLHSGDIPGIKRWNDAVGVRNWVATKSEFDGPPFDANAELVGLPNGRVWDLAAGGVKDDASQDFVSKRIGATPQPGTPRRFLRFLLEVLPSQADVRWLLRFMGYSLTGHTREHQFLYLRGAGRNGKGVLMELMQKLLEDYWTGVNVTGLLGRDDLAQHPTWLAALDGARLVTLDELQADPIDPAKLKQLAAGDRQNARFMRMDPFNFKPIAKFWLAGNYMPNFKRGGYSMVERIRILPFPRQFDESSRDPRLIEKLEDELPQILWLLMQQARLYLTDGLLPETTDMRAERNVFGDGGAGDPVMAWAKARCRFSHDLFLPSKEMLADLDRQGHVKASRVTDGILASLVRAAPPGAFIKKQQRKLDGKNAWGVAGVALKPMAVEQQKQTGKGAIDGRLSH